MAEPVLRPIACIYYEDLRARNVVKTTRSKHPSSAILHAVDHLQLDHYGASLCEVFNSQTGVLWAVLKRTAQKIEIVYKRKVKEPK